MGYETKVYFVEPSRSKSKDNFIKVAGCWSYLSTKEVGIKRGERVVRSYARTIAAFYLNKVGVIHAKETELYIIGSDGNTPVIEDGYDVKLRQLSLHDFVKWIDTKLETCDYRALKACKALAESLIEEYNDVQVLIYGY